MASPVIPFKRPAPTDAERGYFGVMYRLATRIDADESCLAVLRLRLGLTKGSVEEAQLLAEGLLVPAPSGETQ